PLARERLPLERVVDCALPLARTALELREVHERRGAVERAARLRALVRLDQEAARARELVVLCERAPEETDRAFQHGHRRGQLRLERDGTLECRDRVAAAAPQ